MTQWQAALTIAVSAAVTVALRALPFTLFSGGKKIPAFVSWLGARLPRAVMGMLVVYCLRAVSFGTAADWLPALLGVGAAVLLHLWKRQMILSIAGSTAVYMILIRLLG